MVPRPSRARSFGFGRLRVRRGRTDVLEGGRRRGRAGRVVLVFVLGVLARRLVEPDAAQEVVVDVVDVGLAAEAGEAGQAEALAARAIGIAPAGRAAEVAQTACRHLAALQLTEAQVNLLTRALSLEPRAPAELRLTLAELLVGLDRADEARSLARKTLEEVPAPDASLKVRTHRYREKLAKLTE